MNERYARVRDAILATKPPYWDEVQRRSGLADETFKETVEDMISDGSIFRCSAPFGALIYYGREPAHA